MSSPSSALYQQIQYPAKAEPVYVPQAAPTVFLEWYAPPVDPLLPERRAYTGMIPPCYQAPETVD